MHKLYEMKLHETYHDAKIRANIDRVPGGWVYQIVMFRSILPLYKD